MGDIKRKLKKLGHHLDKAQKHYHNIVPRAERKAINGLARSAGKAAVKGLSAAANTYMPGSGAIVNKVGGDLTGKIESRLSQASKARQAVKASKRAIVAP